MNMENCKRCNSEKIKVTANSYPVSYECSDCGYMFLKVPKALIDE